MMCQKQFLFFVAAVFLQCPSCYKLEVAPTSQDKQSQLRKPINVTDFENMSKAKTNISEKNCFELLKNGNNVSGVYVIQPNNASKPFAVRCNMDVQGGGWTYVLNRYDGSQDFYLKWDDYKRGFGDLKGEFWLGLDHLYELTGSEDNELLVELVGFDNKKAYAKYDQFKIGGESEGYPLKVLKGYTGDAGHSLESHLGYKFTTYDRDNDLSNKNCASVCHGAWWYHWCYQVQLTGIYYNSSKFFDGKGMIWGQLGQRNLKEARMMIRCQNK